MLPISVTVLGTSAARPYHDQFTSSIFIECGGDRILIDCGEGIQVQLDALGKSAAKLSVICITHLHGDHVYGLCGLLTSLALGQRSKELTLIGPPSLQAYVEQSLLFSHAHLTYPVHYVLAAMEAPQLQVCTLRELSISCLPMSHRVPAVGFGVSTKDKGLRLREGVVERFKIPFELIPAIRTGDDLVHDTGEVVSNEQLTLPADEPRSILYLTDTQPLPAYPKHWPSPTLLLHDATFVSADEALARKTGHSTAAEATAFAKTCHAQRLLLTHLSPRYDNARVYLDDANTAEPQRHQPRVIVELAEQGRTYEL